MRDFCLIGNSHTSQFDSNNLKKLYGYGASIFGLLNENSSLKLKEQILQYQHLNPKTTLIFFLGQTDIEFIYYYRSVKQNKKLDIIFYIDDLIEKYIYFIKNYITNDCIILGINPHVIKDIKHTFNVNFRATNGHPNGHTNGDPNGSNNLTINFEDYTHIYNDSYEDRFKFNMVFNEKIQVECTKNNIKYCDLTKYILNENNKVKSEYLPDVIDHHLRKNSSLYFYLVDEINNLYK